VLYPLFGSPRLPIIEKSQPHKIDLSGTVVRFSVPPFYDQWGSQRHHPKRLNIYDLKNYVQGEDPTPFVKLFESTWRVKGLLLLKKEIGWVSFSMTLMKLTDNENILNQRLFERALKNNYENLYGLKGRYNKNSFETLLNWNTLDINGKSWVTYWGKKESLSETSYPLIWETPISEEHALSFNFCYQNTRDNKEVPNAVKSFAQKIMHSVHVELSPSAQQQKEAAEKQWPGQRYSEHMEPLRWIRPKKDFMSIEEFLAEDDEP